MNSADERAAFRKRLVDLTDVELAQWMFLAGLAARIEVELEAFASLFAPAITLDPAPDTDLVGIQLLLQGELRRRSFTRTTVHTEGEHHANHEQNSSEH